MECSDQKTHDLYNPRKLPPDAFVSRIELLGRHLEIDTQVFKIWAIQNKTPLIMLYDYDVKAQRSIEVAARLEEEAAIENGRSPGTPWTVQDTVLALLMRVRNEQTPQREREYDLRTLSIGRLHPTGHFVGLLCENDAFAFRLGVL